MDKKFTLLLLSVISVFFAMPEELNAIVLPNDLPFDLSNIRPGVIEPFQSPNLEVNESRTFTIYANKTYNWINVGSGVDLFSGPKYRLTVGSREWNNGSRETTAAGYTDSLTLLKPRFPQYKWMALVGALYTENKLDRGHIADTQFLIGNGRDSWVPFRSGWIAVYANDCFGCYGDNSRVVTLTIKRTE